MISAGHIISGLMYALQLSGLNVPPDQMEARLVWGSVRALPASRRYTTLSYCNELHATIGAYICLVASP